MDPPDGEVMDCAASVKQSHGNGEPKLASS